jgi:dolichol-phosphate mannosyltransferase
MVRTHGVRKSTAEQSDSTLGATVVIPTYNESESIKRVIERCLTAMETSGYRTEVLVVDDDSPDGTVDVVHQRYGGDDRVSVFHRTSDPGLARAVTDGFRRARHEVCAVMDADLQHPPERLPALLDALESDGADVAVGSRHVAARAPGRLWRTRTLGIDRDGVGR